jgi:hypothetical protein
MPRLTFYCDDFSHFAYSAAEKVTIRYAYIRSLIVMQLLKWRNTECIVLYGHSMAAVVNLMIFC